MKISFVCTGNTCRSPMAEGILRKMAKDQGLDLQIESAGIHAVEGLAPSQNAILAAKELDVDISHQKSKLLDKKMVERSDLILVMSTSHLHFLQKVYPQYRDKIHLLKAYSLNKNDSVDDPYGGNLSHYQEARDEIYKSLEALVDKIKK